MLIQCSSTRTAHAKPVPFELPQDPTLRIAQVLESRRVGQRYDYLIQYEGTLANERVWTPLYDLPFNACVHELIEHFHRSNPRTLKPHSILFTAVFKAIRNREIFAPGRFRSV